VTRRVPNPEWQGQKAASNSVTVAHPAPARNSLAHKTEVQPAELATYRRIKKENLLTLQAPVNNHAAAFNTIFGSDNDQMGETRIRDTVVTIFPPGR
jgi:hypothetical protein